MACEAVQLLVGNEAKPWVAAGRALLSNLFRPAPGGGFWSLALCGRPWLFPQSAGEPALPEPLRAMAVGLRALPPLQNVGPIPEPGEWCWHIPLWSNPFIVARQTWDWYGQQRAIAVGMDWVVPGLTSLPKLQSVGQVVHCLRLLEGLCGMPGGPGVLQEAYKMHVWEPILQRRPPYYNLQRALTDLRQLVSAVPSPWLATVRAEMQACFAVLRPMPAVTAASLSAARARLCGNLGWRQPTGSIVCLTALTVQLATRLQCLDAHVAIAPRHATFLSRVRGFDALPAAAPLPEMP